MSIAQRGLSGSRKARLQRRNELRVRNETAPGPVRPANLANLLTYGLRMRNTRGGQSGAWATYAKAARESAGTTQSQLARQLGVDRVTVYRWEKGQQRPEDAEIVRRFAEVLKLDLEEALAAAGMLPGRTAPSSVTRHESADEREIRVIQESNLSQPLKERLIAHARARQERDRKARMEEIKMIADTMGERWRNPDVD